MDVTTYLLDKSAYVRLGWAQDAATWASRIDRGLVRVTSVTALEIGYSARSGEAWHAMFAAVPLSRMPVEYITPRAERRALEVQGALADRGRHRAPSIPDLLIAAAAEMAGLTILHLDKDFTLIAEITGQPMETLDVAG